MDARDERRDDPDPFTTHPAPSRVVMFLVTFVALLGGFYLMGVGIDDESPWLFTGGMVLAGGAFALPMRESRA
ncbi:MULTISPECIES: hypothetical protein [unclassified Actinotalea]|uniref:hypothetical protein n=1 Tax=unclassified Actinotalea TaxID=2638618 RepID=UPI0015F396B8|nr:MULTISPECIES: hypothetical protein [unclassified Actinotalea]